MKKININELYKMKAQGQKIVMITAYDALFARLFDESAVIVLVGDSLNMSFGGKDSTIDISVDEMIYHAKAVKRGLKHAYMVVDMPFASCATPELAVKNCAKVCQQTLCDAIKIEGGAELAPTIKLLKSAGIAVVAHIGLKPQHSVREGGFVVCRDESTALSDAKALEDAGAAMLLIEGTLSHIAAKIASSTNIPVISIGAGASTDGQVLVWSDMLGFFTDFKPKFVRRYMDGAQLVKQAVANYADDVRNGKFPTKEHEYEL